MRFASGQVLNCEASLLLSLVKQAENHLCTANVQPRVIDMRIAQDRCHYAGICAGAVKITFIMIGRFFTKAKNDNFSLPPII